ncbi:hypothetical protein BgAZ_500850 [Babesia gibsoni]|uniref:6-Cys domain-containing protein n=1 Tax=Babesia gibsoni TaxID=33632 RepID=A0AAD8PC86_BABGI|nr:hypothetical protein BgAZ_500850 [Babesia gibsoni]
MARIFWLISLLASAFISVEAFKWTALNIEELSIEDESKRVVVSRGIINDEFAIRLECPKPYVVYPRNDESTKADPHVFVEAGGDLVEVPFSRVIHSLYGEHVVKTFHGDTHNVVEIHYPGSIYSSSEHVVNIIRGHASHIYFLCALPHKTFHHTLTSKLRYLNAVVGTPTVLSIKQEVRQYLKDRSSAVGLFSIDIAKIKKRTHGCGSKDTPEFVNEVHHDVESGVRSCTVDIMEHPDVGFYCKGRIEPSSCFRFLFDSETSREIRVDGVVYMKQSTDDFWNLATYDRKSLKHKFSGYCQCVDEETGEVKAKITVMTGMSHECDLNAMLLQHRAQPIIGSWCDVGLLPGSTLTIKLPVNIYGEVVPESGEREEMQQQPPLLTSHIEPPDLKNNFFNGVELSRQNFPPHIYSASEMVFGDALQIDQSRQDDEGIIRVHYLEDRPLTYPLWLTGFSYIWHLKTNKDRVDIKEISAVINVIPLPTHDYYMYGCEPVNASAFSLINDLSVKKTILDIYGNKMRLCHFVSNYIGKYGLYCPPGQTVYPINCGKYTDDNSLENIGERLYHGNSVVNSRVSNMRIIRSLFHEHNGYSISCACLDGNGVETAKAIVSRHIQRRAFFSRLSEERYTQIVIPSINISYVNIGGDLLPEVQEIHHPLPSHIHPNLLSPGRRLTIWFSKALCEYPYQKQSFSLGRRRGMMLLSGNYIRTAEPYDGETSDQTEVDELSNYEALFLPLNVKNYFYQDVFVDGQQKMILKQYSEVLGTNTTGFNVETTTYTGNRYEYYSITFTSSLSSIIVSKNNDDVINLYYLCGSLARPSRKKPSESFAEMDEYMAYDADIEDFDEEERQLIPSDTLDTVSSDAEGLQIQASSDEMGANEANSLKLYGITNIAVETTDPYLHGCGMTDPREELFRDDTLPILNDVGEKVGCEVDLAEGDASFYCPFPYITEPRNCIPQSPTAAFRVIQPGRKGNEHFYVFKKGDLDSSDDSMLRITKREIFECHCVTSKGIRMATIRVHA